MKLFKDSFSFENRCEESTRIKHKYPHRVPIIVEKAKNCTLSDPDKKKYLVPNGETFVIADGEGRNSVYLASRGFKVTASDYSEIAHQKAKALAASQNVEVNYKLEDFFDINWSRKQYDNVIGICFQFVPPEKINEVLMGLRTATKKGGTLLVHGYTPDQINS